MTPKNAALLAFIGTLLLTILVTFDFVNTVSGVLRDIVPVMALVRSLIYLLASVTVTLFFFLFYKA
jgi:sorbitol-specific phosphotransferase system component IIBC